MGFNSAFKRLNDIDRHGPGRLGLLIDIDNGIQFRGSYSMSILKRH